MTAPNQFTFKKHGASTLLIEATFELTPYLIDDVHESVAGIVPDNGCGNKGCYSEPVNAYTYRFVFANDLFSLDDAIVEIAKSVKLFCNAMCMEVECVYIPEKISMEDLTPSVFNSTGEPSGTDVLLASWVEKNMMLIECTFQLNLCLIKDISYLRGVSSVTPVNAYTVQLRRHNSSFEGKDILQEVLNSMAHVVAPTVVSRLHLTV
jgi:hypothetical protein